MLINSFLNIYLFVFPRGLRRFSTLLVISMAFFTSCLERYHPDELYLREGLLVINAHITDQAGTQTIEISRSANIEGSRFEPEMDCFVLLSREDGESMEFSISENPGLYTADLTTDFLTTGIQYQLQVITGDGKEYLSDFDQIRPVPAIDSIYYKAETRQVTGDEEPVPGIRFYVDFTFDNEAYEFIRWELTETYEFHNPDMEAFVYPNRWTLIPLEGEDNPRICYITHPVPSVHSISTKQLNPGSFTRAFDFIPYDKLDQKLIYKYSLLVKQYSMGSEGFHYWNELGKNHQGQGTLFDSQPALVKSNISNVADESEKVLGFFSMSAMQEVRAFAKDIPGIPTSAYSYYCLPVDSGPGSNRPTTYPSYFARATYDGVTVYAKVNKHCVDCREYKNSTEVKPDFW
jgi:hypothetical protein